MQKCSECSKNYLAGIWDADGSFGISKRTRGGFQPFALITLCDPKAKFIGKINTIPAEVQAVTDSSVTLRVFQHTYRIDHVVVQVTPGQMLNVFVRPELVKLDKDLEQGQFKGVIKERTFLGEKVDYILDVNGHQLSATSYDPFQHETFSLNQELGVYLDEKSIKILNREEESS